MSRYFHSYEMLFLRYSIFAGIAFVVFYLLFRTRFQPIKIQKVFPKKADYVREVLFSLFSMGVLALFVFSLRNPLIRAHTRIYMNVNDYGWIYFVASIFLALLIHDAYFYWMHRLMHHPALFKLFHLVHHRSTNPSPWAAYSFHPLEAIVEGAIVWVIVFLIPIHPAAIRIFALFMILYNVYGHLGYEIYPRWILRSPVGKWLNTSTNHNMHHKYFNDNYGLYFRFWDRIMGTTHPKYEQTLEELISR